MQKRILKQLKRGTALVAAFALTDHDCIAGNSEAAAAAVAQGVEFINGIRIYVFRLY